MAGPGVRKSALVQAEKIMQTGLPVETEKPVFLKLPFFGSTAIEMIVSLSSLSANRNFFVSASG